MKFRIERFDLPRLLPAMRGLGTGIVATLSFAILALARNQRRVTWQSNPVEVSGDGAECAGICEPACSNSSHDVATRGIHEFPGSKEKLLTGYAYGEYYDGICTSKHLSLLLRRKQIRFSNLARVSRRQKTGRLRLAHSREHVAEGRTRCSSRSWLSLQFSGSQQTGSYEWLRAEFEYGRLQKVCRSLVLLRRRPQRAAHGNSSDASAWTTLSRSAT